MYIQMFFVTFLAVFFVNKISCIDPTLKITTTTPSATLNDLNLKEITALKGTNVTMTCATKHLPVYFWDQVDWLAWPENHMNRFPISTGQRVINQEKYQIEQCSEQTWKLTIYDVMAPDSTRYKCMVMIGTHISIEDNVWLRVEESTTVFPDLTG